MAFEQFARPITKAMRNQFLTARAVARHMTSRGSGVILTITGGDREAVPTLGGTGRLGGDRGAVSAVGV